MLGPFTQNHLDQFAKSILSGRIKTPIFEIIAVNPDKSIRVRFKDAASCYGPAGPVATYYDRYDMEEAGCKLATATGRNIQWFDDTPHGRGSKIRDKA